MALPAPSNITFVPGKLCVTPTDLGIAFPHGGTALGLTRNPQWKPNSVYERVSAEEFGGAIVQAPFISESIVFACVTREFDNDMVAQLFVDNATGATTGRALIRGRVTTDAYRAQLLAGVALYFSPDDPLAPGVYLYRAMPLVDESSAVNLALGTEFGILTAWAGTPNEDGNVKEIGTRADIEAATGLSG